jgi:hypothetical protein
MTRHQWQQLEATVAKMTDDEKLRLMSLVSKGDSTPQPSPESIIGAFADDAELIEQIIQDTYRLRETQPFRTGE